VKNTLPPEMVIELEQLLGHIRMDLTSRLLYSTDASIYQIDPLGVGFPRSQDELAGAVEISGRYGIPVLARGSGSSLGGQAIGPALILDCSRYLTKIIDIDPEQRTAIVEPGVILTTLNNSAAAFGLQFGPDPASAERATLGGSLANNATGAHSILYGMAADHLVSAEVVMADGSLAELKCMTLQSAAQEARNQSLVGEFYRTALDIRERHKDAIQKNWPRTWRNASGYPLNYILPWSPTFPPQWEAQSGWVSKTYPGAQGLPYPPVPENHINLASLLAGSEGTLAVIRSAKLRLVPVPDHKVLGVLAYPTLAAACEAVPELLEYNPSAIELIPESLIRLARSLPAYAHQISFINQLFTSNNPAALLVVEFSGDNPAYLLEMAKRLGPGVLLAETRQSQAQVWAVRKVGLGILNSRPGNIKPLAFIEDIAVPVEHLGQFVRGMENIFEEHAIQADFYAHASAGCLHIRPLLDLKSSQGKKHMRAVASQAVDLAITFGGTVSGEHGDGLARSEWLEQVYGSEIIQAFNKLKTAADPKGILNPGKIVQGNGSGALPKMDDNLRYDDNYQPAGWQPIFDYSRQGSLVNSELVGEAGLIAAVEMCNGAGVCRKTGGVMCPSFQAKHDEMHSTRGRANLLRAMMSGRFPDIKAGERAVYEALDLCLACKGCKSECPSGVDMAKLRYEFLNHYYRKHRRRVRDYLFGYIGLVARLGYRFAPIANFIMSTAVFKKFGLLFGLTPYRPFPKMASRPLSYLARDLVEKGTPGQSSVLFLSDAFTDHFHPETGLAAIRVLRAAGYRVHLLPVSGAGRTLISKGFLPAAIVHAKRLINEVERIDPENVLPVVGVEPSEILTLRDEYHDMFPGEDILDRVDQLASRSYSIEEFLIRPGANGELRILRIGKQNRDNMINKMKVLLHGHCYQKAQPPAPDGYPSGVSATIAMLEAVGYDVKLIDSGCCGMAGAFGYETEHYDLSMDVGELGLFPAIRATGGETIIAAAGVSCQAQIQDGTQREAVHPIRLVDQAIHSKLKYQP
jgi:FAD/FMN-containing dehydrogenase/Fe-S oxidoreductase